jgi:hypothetical protein
MFHFSKRSGYCFGLNALGEVFRNDEYILGSVEVSTCAREVLSDAELQQWSKFNDRSKRWQALNARVQQAVDHEFERQARTELTAPEYDLYAEIVRLQKVDNGRWRVYGGMKGKNQLAAAKNPSINLVTEFKEFTDGGDTPHGVKCSEWWKRLYALGAKLGAQVSTLDEGKELEHSYRTDDQGKKIPGSDKYGENHGRPYRQVEMIWEIKGRTLEEVQAMIADLDEKLQALWEEAGVGVY